MDTLYIALRYSGKVKTCNHEHHSELAERSLLFEDFDQVTLLYHMVPAHLLPGKPRGGTPDFGRAKFRRKILVKLSRQVMNGRSFS